MSGKDEAYLIILNGPLKGGVFVLSKISVFEIGRADGCHIKLPDELCGFNHARISVRHSEWRFTNLNEERGSSINDIKVDSRVLEGFEVIRVGTTELQFTLVAPNKDGVVAEGAETVGPKESRSVGVAPTMLGALPTQRPPAPAPAPAAPPAPVVPAPVTPARVAAPPPTPPAPPKPVRTPAPVATGTGSPASSLPPLGPPAEPTPAAAPPPPPPPVAEAPKPVARVAVAESPAPPPPSAAGVTGQTEALAGMDLPPSKPTETTKGFRVKVIDGCDGDLGREVDFLQGATCIVGRSVSSDFMLVDGKISRAHCSIELRDGVLIACDLDSSNGVVVNGERIQKTLIKPGDYIRLGFTVLGVEEIDLPVR